jgi:hypothetical protein
MSNTAKKGKEKDREAASETTINVSDAVHVGKPLSTY